VARVPITCSGVLDLLTDYLEAALAPQVQSRVEHHLAECDGCARYLDQLGATMGALGALAEDDVPPDVRERLLMAFRSWRHADL
jgi:predicted anti-sigma-YlaC factor YlaD